MFADVLEDAVGSTDAELDERLRANELALRALQAERAAVIGVIEHRGAFRADGHRSMAGYLRATVNGGPGTVTRDRKLARLLVEHPAIGDSLAAGRITVDQALEIARADGNPRIRHLLGVVVDVLLEQAEHCSHRAFVGRVDDLVAALDDDGAFDDLTDAVDGRRASVHDVGGQVIVAASGGDPVQAAQLQAIFERFVDAEFAADVAARRQRHGDDADRHELARTSAQRRFDALVSIFAAAAASPDGRALPQPTVHLVVDIDTAHDALAHAGVVLPNGDTVELGDDGAIVDDGLLPDLAAELADDPERFFRRRCETSTGSRVHPSVVLRSLLTGHVRRVVVDSQGVVVDYGTRQRLFSGLAREAAMLLADRCEHPGCDVPARWSQVDHNVEWSDGGRTDQRNRNIECGHHNRFKHRQRWRTRRDDRGRAYTIRADGTIVLPVGERPPDLSADELAEITRARLHGLRTTQTG